MRLRGEFHRDIAVLTEMTLLMGSMVERQIAMAVTALEQLDHATAQQVIDDDARTDQLRFEIEERAVNLLARQQPMASDLRIIVAVLDVIVDLERIGDHAKGIGKIVLRHGEQPALQPLVYIPRMTTMAVAMLRRALLAFMNGDSAAASEVISQDEALDELYRQACREQLAHMLVDPRTIGRGTWLIWVAHNLERVGDRAANIAERVRFVTTGQLPGGNGHSEEPSQI